MNWVLLRNSLLVGGMTTGLSVSIGFLSALWLAGLAPRVRTWFLGAAILALALPPFLVTNSWLDFLGPTGVWHKWLPFDIFSLGGTVWILSLLLWPLSLLLVWGAWQRLEPAQLEGDLRVTGWALVRVLLLPLARSGLIQAAILTFALALNNFAVPAILQIKVLPAEMWIRFNTTFDTPGALAVSWPLALAPLFLVFWLSRHELPWPHLEPPVSARLFRAQLGPAWFWFSGACSVLVSFCVVVLPLSQILSARRTWTELPGAIAAGQNAIWNSFWYASAAAAVVVGVSLFVVTRFESRRPCGKTRRPKAETRKKAEIRNPNQMAAQVSPFSEASTKENLVTSRRRQFGFRISAFFRASDFGLRIYYAIAAAAWLAFLLPGVLLGIGLIHAFNHGWSALFYQSAGIVILAFAIRYLVIGWHAARQAIRKVDRDLIDVAHLEGATRWQMLKYVQWPQIARPALLTWYIVFLLCLWDVESLILVVPPGGETLALRVFNLLHYGHNAQVNALCLALLGLALVPLVLSKSWQSLASVLSTSGGPISRHSPLSRLLLTTSFLVFLTSCSPPSNSASLHSQLFNRVQIIGSRGVGVGQLNKPRSVAVDLSDNLYVVDMTGRVQKFSSNGVFLLSWQMPQIERGKPKGMGRDRDGNILVVEPHYSRVNLFSPAGKLLGQWGNHGTNDGQFSLPRGVAVDSRREIFVSEYQEIERVQKFALDPSVSEQAAGLTTTGLRPAPRWVCSFGQAGTAPGEFNRPEGLCVDAQDRLYVADSCNHRIQIFSSEGKFLHEYGKPGKGLGELSYPYDICVDKEGRQYVCEFGNSRIQVFDARNKPIEIIGGPGPAPGWFSNPWGVALDSVGNLYVADSQNHRVQKLVRKQ
jgi:ABC-type Fe3+ transport system permease subunit/DNA-binding beta-propeller fold protein YncE